MAQEKLVIYKALDDWCITPKSNYGASIRNARKIQVMRGFSTPDEIIDYYCRYFNCKTDDFIVVD